MVKVIMGLKGSGKTKQLIDSINESVRLASGNVVCIEKSNKLRFDIDYRVRLIEADEYGVENYTFLKGFICGLKAGNADITDLYIDGIFRIVNSTSLEELETFLAWAKVFAQKNEMKITLTVSEDIAKATEQIKAFF